MGAALKRKNKTKQNKKQDKTSTPERELQKRKGICTLGGHLTDGENSQDGQMGNLKASDKSTAARRGKAEREQHRPVPGLAHHSLRHLGGGWAPDLGFRKVSSGRGLGLAVCKQPEGVREWCPMG